MFFSDLKIKNKIIATSAIIMIAMIGLISISYIFFGKIGNEMDTFYKVQYVNTKNQMEIRRDIQTVNKRILVALISQDTNVVDEQISDFDKRFDKMENIINDMEKTLGDQVLVESMKSSFQNLKSGSYELMNLAKSGQSEEAIAVYNTTFNDVISEGFADVLSEVGALSDKQAEDKYAESIKIGNQAVIVLVIVAIISLAIIMFAFLLLIKNIIKPVTALEVAAEKMENGDFDINIDYESKDELGELANGFRIMSENTREIIIDTNRLLDEMANRNFNVSSECRDSYVGEYQKLYTGICDVRDNMTHALTEVKQASEQVNISSEQVSSVANHLAQGATEQSLAIDELLTRIQEITNQTNSNVSNAVDTSNLAQEAGNGINNANNSMNSLMLAIDDINVKSTEIGKIIKTIDDIAFQTNILALNAAVEAARAGESGRGFSVVADEVRNLAGKSAEASKNIADLIKSTIDSISNGTALANETEDNLLNVVTSASNMVSLVDEIVKSSENQAQSISQIKMGIEQISQVVQNNSATAEEVAATSEELSGQANAMKELVEQFTLEESLIL